MAVVVVNLDGEALLPPCLDSLLDLDYEGETRILVVDNGSEDGSLDLLAEKYAHVEVLAQSRNTGFAPAVNVGVRAAGSVDCVALVNNDMRVDRAWLSELVGHLDVPAGVVCVGGLILSDDGKTVDFAEGSLAFNGMGDQVGFGTPVEDLTIDDGADLLFACGGSILVDRATFLEVGGFDDAFFAYFEDVDLGWRLRVLGHRTVLARQARSFHLHHGTAGRFPRFQREFLVERNALAAAFKNYDDAHLAEILAPALLLLAKRSVLKGGLDRRAYDLGGSPAEVEEVGRDVLVGLMAMADLVDGLDGLLERRRAVQTSRRAADADVLDRFLHPMRPSIAHPDYLVAQRSVVAGFGLDARLSHQRASVVVVVGAAETLQPEGWDVEVRPVGAADWAAVARTADVVVVPLALVAGRPERALGSWPVVVGVAVTADDVVVTPGHVDVDAVLVAGTFSDSLLAAWPAEALVDADGLNRLLAAPWRWRRSRRAARWASAATEDLQAWIAWVVDQTGLERSLRAEEASRHAAEVADLATGHAMRTGELKRALNRRRHEVAALRRRQQELEEALAGHEQRLDRLRRTPLWPLLCLAARARRRVLRRRAP